jgi:hypothetical protein
MTRRALAATLLLSSACFNFDTSYETYCARTGRCDGGVGQGGGSGVGGSQGGGSAGGGAQGGGSAQGGGGGGSQGGGSAGGGSQGGGAGGGGGGGNVLCGGVQCTTPINGSAFCDAGQCDITCNPTAHRCGFSCADNSNGAACGPLCISCPNPGGSWTMRTCDAGVCDFGCTSGFQRCGSQCLPANSVQSCGAACSMCSAPGAGTAFCDAGSCDFSCPAPAMRVGNTCISPPTMTFPNISDVSDPNTFIDARLDPNAKNTLWALDFSGQLLVSNDLAQTVLTVVCRLPGTGLNSTWSGFGERTTARIHLSHGVDRTAYVISPIVANSQSYLGRVYRADQSTGLCTDVTPFTGSNYLWTSGLGASFAVAGDGTLYEFDGDNSGSRLRRSSDHGSTWTALQDAGSLGSYWAGTLSAGPGPDLLLSVFTGGNSPQGLYLVTDGGTVLNKVSAAIFGTDVTARFSWAVPGAAYANKGNGITDGFVSANGGLSWTQSTAYAETGDWALDPTTNSGYRLAVYDGGLNVERSVDMSAPIWGRLGSAFFAGQGVAGVDRIDAVGGNVAVVVGGRLFVSSDSGATFRRIGTKPPVVGTGTLDSTDGTRVFLVSTQGGTGAAYESTDKGLTYALRYTSAPLSAQYVSGNLVLITRVNPQNANNVIAWGRNPSNNSDYDQTTLITHDGFLTAAIGADTMTGAWGNSFSFSPSSLNTSYFYSYNINNNSSGAVSTNAGDTYTPFTLAPQLGFVWYPSAQVMGDPTWALVFDCNSSPQALRINNVTHTSLNDGGISNALGNDPPCSAEVYMNGVAWRARVISRSGWLATSDDNGATFTAVAGSGTLPSCPGRNLVSLPTNRNTIFTWCGHDFWVSSNGGVSWTQPTLGQNWVKYGCSQITSLAPSDTNVLVTCSDRPPVAVAWP